MLGLSQVRPEENFFALGGDSLAAARVVGRLGKRVGVRLTARTLFDAPTAALLAVEVERPGGPRVPRVPVGGHCDPPPSGIRASQGSRASQASQASRGSRASDRPTVSRSRPSTVRRRCHRCSGRCGSLTGCSRARRST
ncbi:phosphopantetheine-binding protein [Catenulispora yoronensis]